MDKELLVIWHNPMRPGQYRIDGYKWDGKRDELELYCNAQALGAWSVLAIADRTSFGNTVNIDDLEKYKDWHKRSPD